MKTTPRDWTLYAWRLLCGLAAACGLLVPLGFFELLPVWATGLAAIPGLLVVVCICCAYAADSEE